MNAIAVFWIFLRLGLTSFGGPIAHLGYFREEFVARRHWLSERSYADLVALCQFLPGPASSQVGMAIGLSRAGFGGALAAWLGFTMPSAIALTALAVGLSQWGASVPPGVLHGLKLVAVAVVAQAVWGMARLLWTDLGRIVIGVLSAAVALAWTPVGNQLAIIAAAALCGWLLGLRATDAPHESIPIAISRRTATILLVLFVALLAGLPVLAHYWPIGMLVRATAFYRVGSTVFGGGHVVLPLLQSEVVTRGWLSTETLMTGYAAAQAVPGPLFSFAAFLGASMSVGARAWIAGLAMLVAIFTPSFLMVAGALPFWEQLRQNVRAQAMFAGVNAAVVGLLLAALYRPVWTTAVLGLLDLALVLIAFGALTIARIPPWVVVCGSVAAGWGVGSLR